MSNRCNSASLSGVGKPGPRACDVHQERGWRATVNGASGGQSQLMVDIQRDGERERADGRTGGCKECQARVVDEMQATMVMAAGKDKLQECAAVTAVLPFVCSGQDGGL